MSEKALGVGLLGLGTVGSAVARAFADRSRRIDAAAGRPVKLVAAAVRDAKRPRDAGDVPVTTDPHAILDDPDVAIVVEVIGGTDPARELVLGSFERRKHVVTANKELVAKEWNAVHESARLAKRELRFEAAVAAAVPVIAGMRGLGAVRPRVLRGLLNGTTTYICSRMENGKSMRRSPRPGQPATRRPIRRTMSTGMTRRTSSRSSSRSSRAGTFIRTTCGGRACVAFPRRSSPGLPRAARASGISP